MAVRRRIGEALKGFADAFGPLYQQQQYYDRLARGDERAQRAEDRQLQASMLQEASRVTDRIRSERQSPDEAAVTIQDYLSLYEDASPEFAESMTRRLESGVLTPLERGSGAAEVIGEGLPFVSDERRDEALKAFNVPFTEGRFERDYPGGTPVQGSVGYLGSFDPGGPDPAALAAFDTTKQAAVDIDEAIKVRAREEMADRLMLQNQTGVRNFLLPDERAVAVMLRPNVDDPQAGAIVENVLDYRPGMGASPFPSRSQGLDLQSIAAAMGGADIDDDTLALIGGLQGAPGYAPPAWTGEGPFELQFEPGMTFPELLSQFEYGVPAVEDIEPDATDGSEAPLTPTTSAIPFDPATALFPGTEVIAPDGTVRYVPVTPWPSDAPPPGLRMPGVSPEVTAQHKSHREIYDDNRIRVTQELEENAAAIAAAEQALEAVMESYASGQGRGGSVSMLTAGVQAKADAEEDLAAAIDWQIQLQRHMAGLEAHPYATVDPWWNPPSGVDVGGGGQRQTWSVGMVPPATPRSFAGLPGSATVPSPITAPLPMATMPITPRPPITAPLPMGTMPITPRQPFTMPPTGRVQGGGLPPVPPITATMPVPGAQRVDLSGRMPSMGNVLTRNLPIPSVTTRETFPGAGPRAPQPPPTLDPSWLPSEPGPPRTTSVRDAYGPPAPPVESEPIPEWGPGKIPPQAFSEYAPFVAAASQKHGVPQELIWSVMLRESAFDPTAVGSESGELGLMQLTPDPKFMAEEFDIRKVENIKPTLLDERSNIEMGTQYLKTLYQLFGDWKLAVAAYNAGPGRVWQTDPQWWRKYGPNNTPQQRQNDPGNFTIPSAALGYVNEVFGRGDQLAALAQSGRGSLGAGGGQ